MFQIIEDHYRQNYNKYIKKLTFRAGTKEAAEDITQEAYYRAINYYNSFDTEGDFNRWFLTILNNSLREYKNNEKGHTQQEYNEEEPIIINEGVFHDIKKLIRDKPKHHQEILKLHYILDYSPIDISRVTDNSVYNCHKVISRFRDELKKIYK